MAAEAPAVITTDRLVLRRPLLSDADDVYAYARDPAVTRQDTLIFVLVRDEP